MSKGIFLFFPPAHTHTVQYSLHLHASNASHILGATIFFNWSPPKRRFLTIYSWNAQMGRRPYKLHFDTPDAPLLLPFSPDPGGSGSIASIWGSSLFPSAKKKERETSNSDTVSQRVDAPASHWLSLGGCSHSERLWGCVHWTAESAWAQAHSHCQGGRGSSRRPASPACGRSPPEMERTWPFVPICSLMNKEVKEEIVRKNTHSALGYRGSGMYALGLRWHVEVRICIWRPVVLLPTKAAESQNRPRRVTAGV